MAECSVLGGEIHTLENCLKLFNMECLLEQLDISLDLLRRNKINEKDHLDVLKSVDRNLLKLSRTYHPDKAINEQKSFAQNRQVALNATRTVLQALTEAFLGDIDIHYRYELFAKMNINSLTNEKEMNRQINNVLSKISLLSEVKRMSIVGEIRKFLKVSRESLKSFQDDDEDEFERHRDFALRYLQKCIEGYKVHATECELIVKECRGEQDESARSAIQRTYDQNRRELNILQNLERVAKKSLDGTFRIYSINEAVDKYDFYLVSPFVLYINVMLMCTSVMSQKSGVWKKVKEKYAEVTCSRTHNIDNSPQFHTEPILFLKAYHLASYLRNKAQHEREVEIICSKMGIEATTANVIEEFKQTVKSIEDFLEKEFDINSYKVGKSNREQFVDKLSRLNETMTGYREAEKELQEKLNLCKKETSEIRKEYFEFSEKFQETEVQCEENILKCKNASEDIAKLISKCYQREDTESKIFYGNKINEITRNNRIKEDTTEIKLVKRLDQYEKMAESLLDFLTDCRKNASLTGHQSSSGSRNECSLVIDGEIEKKIEASYRLNEEINEQLYCLMTHSSKYTEEILKQDNSTEKNLVDNSLKKLNHINNEDEIRESSGIYDTQCFALSASEQNLSQNTSMTKVENESSYKPNVYEDDMDFTKECGDENW